MSERLLRIFCRSRTPGPGPAPETVVEAAEPLINGTDPGLRLSSGHRRMLWAASHTLI